MASWSREFEDGYALATEAATRLRELNPTHELLKYRFVPEGEETSAETEEQIKIEMKDRFWNRERPWQGVAGAEVCAVVYGNYYSALLEAIKEEEAKREKVPG